MPVHLHLPTQQENFARESSLQLGLVNNMPAAAFAATEKQFLSLIAKGAAGVPVSVSLFALPGMLPAGQQERYQGLRTLMERDLDGLVVTGTEPLTRDLRAESYWDSFGVLLEWARKHTISTIWSCLAAHAAVLHLDGIARQKRKQKYYGVFACRQATAHALTSRMPNDLHVPHSRWNGLCHEELVAKGYKVLTCTGDGEVDLFTREAGSLFVFAQGHPEYDTQTLLREYRRDLDRFVRNQTAFFPSAPASYFDAATEAALMTIQQRAQSSWDEALLAETFSVLHRAAVDSTWAASAECLYRNWLALLVARRELRARQPLTTNTTGPRPISPF